MLSFMLPDVSTPPRTLSPNKHNQRRLPHRRAILQIAEGELRPISSLLAARARAREDAPLPARLLHGQRQQPYVTEAVTLCNYSMSLWSLSSSYLVNGGEL